MNELDNEFGISDIEDALMPLADTQVRTGNTLKYLDGEKIEVARVKIHEGSGSYATVLMDTPDNEYADALQSLVDDKEGVGMKNKQVQVYEPNKVV